jgi:drug/metabolite transporter (DMT)-like permease
MPIRTMPPTAAAIAGAVCISSSAVLMKLAHTSPSITALGRCAFALPVLGALAWAERRRGAPPLPARSRWLARLAGLFLAGDLIVWSHAIDAIGAGLSTVLGNLQVLEATAGATVASALLGLALNDYRLGPTWPALGWLALLALTSQVIGWLLITVSMPRLPAGMIGTLLLIQPAGSIALSYVFLGERPSALQLAGVVLILAGVVVAVGGAGSAAGPSRSSRSSRPSRSSRRSTRIIRQASGASTGVSASKSP